MYLPRLACCAGKPPPYVVCQLRRRVEIRTVIRVCEESVFVDLYVEICICWVVRGWGGYPWMQRAAAHWASQQSWVIGAVLTQPVPGVATQVCIRGVVQAYGAVLWDLFTVVRVSRVFVYVVIGLVGWWCRRQERQQSIVDLSLRVPLWCGLGCSFHSGCGWSRVGLRVPVLSRVVDPARWS